MHNSWIAEVIVEIPARPVDRPFDYLVPTEWNDVVKVGSRVQVPFGSRKLLGYVVQLKTDTSVSNLKSIIQVMDPYPPLTEELVALGLRMADEYICHPITALHALVPAVLKGKYEKKVVLHPALSQEKLSSLQQQHPAFFKQLIQQGMYGWDTALKETTPYLLHKWTQDQVLMIEETVSDRTTQPKKRWVVIPDQTKLNQMMEKIPARKKKQKEIMQFLFDQGGEMKLTDLLTQLKTTRSTVQACVEQGWLAWDDRRKERDPYQNRSFEPTTPLPLTGEQQSAYHAIVQPILQKKYCSILLHGVTGSGKTEIYLQSIDQVLKQGKEAIVLVPEISLTPQMVQRFKERLGSAVAVLHSGLSSGERFDEWRKIRNGLCSVVIGARSAIFAPFRNIGLIIIDEEHESTYKQEENPKYHARTIAHWRAERHQSVLVLGSATPAVESYYLARKGDYIWQPLKERVNQMPFPKMEVVDMREEIRHGNRSMFSEKLRQSLLSCVEKNEQAVLFLNRRGFSTFVLCRECGESLMCPSCDISLTYHQTNHTVRCHYCGHAEALPSQCPSCQSSHIRHFGVGTQRVEEELYRHFPELRVIRMDVDTTSRKGSHEKLLSSFSRGEADVLLGTQMIAKGLDFPNVTLVGAIAADSVLHLPDFRAAERTFQLLMQVAGRAGRHQRQGHVVIQSYNTEHYSIQKATQYQITSFYRQECQLRKKHMYPPFCGLFHLLLTHPDRGVLFQIGQKMAAWLRKEIGSYCQLFDPVPAVVPRIKGRYRLQMMIKFKENEQINHILKEKLAALPEQFVEKEFRLSISREGNQIS